MLGSYSKNIVTVVIYNLLKHTQNTARRKKQECIHILYDLYYEIIIILEFIYIIKEE